MSPSKLTPEVWPVADAGPTPADREESILVFQPTDPTEAHYSGSLYITASGLSGGARGQLASRYAAQKVMNTYYNSTEPDLGLRLREAFDAANADLYAYAQQRPELVKVGVALIAAAIRGEQLHVAQVGDSRAYLIREAQIQQITRDHTLVQQLLDEGAIQPDEARDHPRRDVLLRTLGTQEAVMIDIFDVRLRPDDALILCAGGLARSLTNDEIAQVVASKAPRNAAEMLVQKVRGQGLKQPLAVIAALLRDGAPPLTADLPYTWDRQPPSFDEQPTLMVPRARLEDQPPAPPGQMPVGTSLPPIDRTSPAAQTQAATRQIPAEPPIPPEATQPAPPPSQAAPVTIQPAPTYQTPVQPAPPYGAPPQQQAPPPYYPPAPQQPAYPEAQPQPPYPAAPQQPQYPAYGQPQQPPPPGYVIDPVTGLPPVPQAQAGWGAPQGMPAYAPRVYQAPGQPRMQPQRRGVSIGTFALVGMFAVILTALMVLILINPFGWQLPSLGSIAQAPTATVTLPPSTPTLPPATQPPVVEPTVSATPTAPTAPPGMVLIEGGAFLRGVPDTEIDAITLPCIDEAEDNTICNRDFFSDAQPVEQVTLSPFFIDITEVTNRAYAACVAANVCRPPTNQRAYNDPAFAEHPVVFVTWDQAKTYCEWAGKRLPTEAEWEKAARWDERTQQSYIWPWGNTFEVGRANTLSAGQGGTSPVTAFAQDISPSGVLDMAGNVSEWVQDWYYPSYQGLGTLNPTGPASQPLRDALRVARGGSFLDVAAYARGGHRLSVKVDKAADWLGFRCAASVAGATPPTVTPTPTGQPTEGPTPVAPPTEGPTPTATQTP